MMKITTMEHDDEANSITNYDMICFSLYFAFLRGEFFVPKFASRANLLCFNFIPFFTHFPRPQADVKLSNFHPLENFFWDDLGRCSLIYVEIDFNLFIRVTKKKRARKCGKSMFAV